MSDVAFRRIVWAMFGLACIAFWTLAIIGGLSLTAAPQCLSVRDAAKTLRAGPR